MNERRIRVGDGREARRNQRNRKAVSTPYLHRRYVDIRPHARKYIHTYICLGIYLTYRCRSSQNAIEGT